MFVRAAAILAFLLPLAGLPASAGEVILNGVKVLGDDEPAPRDWSACRVKADLLQTGDGGTKTLASESQVLILGENLDIENQYQLSNGRGQALVSLRVRLRASTVLGDGVMYLVTSEGELNASIGFTPQQTSRTQFRHDFLEIEAGRAQTREVYVSPELGIRVILVVSAEPLEDEIEQPLIPTPERAELVRFRVEAKRRFEGRESRLQNVILQAAPGHDASLAVVLRDASTAIEPEEKEAVDATEMDENPEFRLGGRARIVDLPRNPGSGFEKDHTVGQSPIDDEYMARNTRRGDTSYIADHTVELREGPDSRSMRIPKKKKLSKKKQRELRDSAEIRAAKELALERSKTLAGEVGAPEPPPPAEQLQALLRPLHATERHLRMNIRLVGYMALAGDDRPREIDLNFTENVPWGQTLELGLREILEGGNPDSDTILAITPQP